MLILMTVIYPCVVFESLSLLLSALMLVALRYHTLCTVRRPALYGAYHEMHNISRLASAEPLVQTHIVGPICESGDVMGKERQFPPSAPGDIVLICNAGAYGAVMSSRFNMRALAEEVVVDTDAGDLAGKAAAEAETEAK